MEKSDAEFQEPDAIVPSDRVSRVIQVIDAIAAEWREEGEEQLSSEAAQLGEALRRPRQKNLGDALKNLKQEDR